MALAQDPFLAVREELGMGKSNLPAFQATTPGMSVTTLEVPSVQSKEAWNSFLQMFSVADGIVILRLEDKADYDEEGYIYRSPILSQIYEVADSRPMFIITVCKGPVRSSMMFFCGIASLVLATRDSTFGFPEFAQDKTGDFTSVALRKRLTDQVQRRLFLVGDSIDAHEAQRFGLIDFVADDETVENEVCRLIYRNCSPKTQYFMYKPDMVESLEQKEATS
uniref:Uncharacterized protein n=1 Tax=Alexandrium andersonii TaxID=327968 RepID=A0A7S2DML6_9DINO